MKKTLEQWLHEYAESHQNPRNILIHKFCVPLIFFSIIGMGSTFHIWRFSISEWIFLLALPFYFQLGRKAMWLYAIFFFVCMFVVRFLMPWVPMFPVSLGIFVVAWIGQFIGHKLEGKSPSFLKDLQFLLIGPLWVFLGQSAKAADNIKHP